MNALIEPEQMPDSNKEDQDSVHSIRSNQENRAPHDEFVGKVLLDEFEIVGLLGQGGMAKVYKARQRKMNRFVAIKVLTVEQPEAAKRFEKEMKIHGRLNHFNIVEAIDCVVDSSTNRTFFVMAYVDGQSLEGRLKTQGGIRDERLLMTILTDICDALGHAHSQGIIHRDLKPGNILLTNESVGEVRAKLVDFGIAKVQEEIQRLTTPGKTVGSPLYMSPEVCMGRELDNRSDIYSLGILAYEMITGEVPYKDSNLVKVLSAHCNPDVKPQSLAVAAPSLLGTKQLDAVIRIATETEPDKRFQDSSDFKKAVQFWYHCVETGQTELDLPESVRRVKAPVAQEDEQVTAAMSPADLNKLVSRHQRNLKDDLSNLRTTQVREQLRSQDGSLSKTLPGSLKSNEAGDKTEPVQESSPSQDFTSASQASQADPKLEPIETPVPSQGHSQWLGTSQDAGAVEKAQVSSPSKDSDSKSEDLDVSSADLQVAPGNIPSTLSDEKASLQATTQRKTLQSSSQAMRESSIFLTATKGTGKQMSDVATTTSSRRYSTEEPKPQKNRLGLTLALTIFSILGIGSGVLFLYSTNQIPIANYKTATKDSATASVNAKTSSGKELEAKNTVPSVGTSDSQSEEIKSAPVSSLAKSASTRVATVPSATTSATTTTSSAVPAVDLTGTWSSEWGPLTLTQRDYHVTGYWTENGNNAGTLVGAFDPASNVLTISYQMPLDNLTGTARFDLQKEGKVLRGTWQQSDASTGSWTLRR